MMATDTEFSRLLHKVARAYSHDGLTQQQIGERFGLSRVEVAHPIHERIVGTGLETIKSIPRVIVVAGGQAKVPVIRAALHGGLINVLVTDDQTASQLLDPNGPSID